MPLKDNKDEATKVVMDKEDYQEAKWNRERNIPTYPDTTEPLEKEIKK